MYTLQNNAASGYANATIVDRIGPVAPADPMSCATGATVAEAVDAAAAQVATAWAENLDAAAYAAHVDAANGSL